MCSNSSTIGSSSSSSRSNKSIRKEELAYLRKKGQSVGRKSKYRMRISTVDNSLEYFHLQFESANILLYLV